MKTTQIISELNSPGCYECEYFGRPSDAPETVEKDCMWSLLKEKGEEDLPPCVRRLKGGTE